MEDPFSTYTEQEEASGRGIPMWVWGIGGLVLGGGCCLLVIIGVLTLAQPQIDALFNDIVGTLEPEGESQPTAVVGDVIEPEGDGQMFSTVEAVLQRDEDVDPLPQRPSSEPYTAAFDEAGGWATGQITAEEDPSLVEAEVTLEEGVLLFTVYDENGLFWTTGGQYLASGRYQVEATAVSGPLDNGFGMLLMVDSTADDFYMFEISSDGFVWIGYYDNGGELIEPLNGEGWIASEAVKQGLNETNLLTVTADEGELTFLVNDTEVAQTRDFRLLEGDVGVFIETLGEGDVVVSFDNFSYRPLEP